MKICLINNLYKPYNRGGAERVVEIISDELQKQEHEVFIISTKPFLKKSNLIAKNYYINSLYYNLNKISKFLRLFFHIYNIFNVKNYFKIKSILKKEKPDIVMTHNLVGVGFLIPKLIKSLKIKHIHTLHDIQLLHPSGLMIYGKEKIINSFFAKIYQAICRNIFKSPDVVISPSSWLMKMHYNKGFFKDSKKVILSNPVIFKNNKNREIKNYNKKFNFLYVGQLEKHKGILFLINVFKKINNSELIVIGDGNCPVSKNNKNIKFLGKLKNSEVNKLMREADALIMPSLCYENSPTVIYEAFANGLPVISSNIGGAPELLKDGAGILFKAGDGNDLIEKINYATEHKKELGEMSKNGREKIKEFRFESYIKKLISILYT
ncbi:MAG: glycosyltransferase [Candidatus Falkowbacteria bacterium]